MLSMSTPRGWLNSLSYLHTASVPAAEAEHEVERRLLLDVVVRQRPAVLELLAREDQALLVGGDAWER